MPCIIFSPVLSPLVIIYNLCVNFIKSQLHKKQSLIEPYSMTVKIPYVLFFIVFVFSVPVLSWFTVIVVLPCHALL